MFTTGLAALLVILTARIHRSRSKFGVALHDDDVDGVIAAVISTGLRDVPNRF